MARIWIALCTLVGSALLVCACLFALVPETRMWPAVALYKEGDAAKGEDAIVLLMGDAVDRAPHAAALYNKGMGKKIVFVEPESSPLVDLGLRPHEGQMVYDYLTKFLKVPAADIIFNSKTRVSSTREEAREIYKILEKQRFRRVILATSWYHSSRAMWVFGKVGEGKSITLISQPTSIPKAWYRSEQDFLFVFNEYLKWMHNGIKYGLLH